MFSINELNITATIRSLGKKVHQQTRVRVEKYFILSLLLLAYSSHRIDRKRFLVSMYFFRFFYARPDFILFEEKKMKLSTHFALGCSE